jgi:hypothetical protein
VKGTGQLRVIVVVASEEENWAPRLTLRECLVPGFDRYGLFLVTGFPKQVDTAGF